jgi:hypothetical protein
MNPRVVWNNLKGGDVNVAKYSLDRWVMRVSLGWGACAASLPFSSVDGVSSGRREIDGLERTRLGYDGLAQFAAIAAGRIPSSSFERCAGSQ